MNHLLIAISYYVDDDYITMNEDNIVAAISENELVSLLCIKNIISTCELKIMEQRFYTETLRILFNKTVLEYEIRNISDFLWYERIDGVTIMDNNSFRIEGKINGITFVSESVKFEDIEKDYQQ